MTQFSFPEVLTLIGAVTAAVVAIIAEIRKVHRIVNSNQQVLNQTIANQAQEIAMLNRHVGELREAVRQGRGDASG